MPKKNRDALVKKDACSMGRPVAPSLFPFADPANRRAEHLLLRRSGLEWFIALIVLLCIIVARGATTESVGHFATFICVVCVASLLTLSLSKPCKRTVIDCDCATGRAVLRPSRSEVPSPPPSPPLERASQHSTRETTHDEADQAQRNAPQQTSPPPFAKPITDDIKTELLDTIK